MLSAGPRNVRCAAVVATQQLWRARAVWLHGVALQPSVVSASGASADRVLWRSERRAAYDVRYDWPKPTSTCETTFGTSGRLPPYAGATNDTPGPGAYSSTVGIAAVSQRPGNATWGRDVRFAGTSPANSTPDPGKYYHCSTFLTKSHNATIGSDTTWIG